SSYRRPSDQHVNSRYQLTYRLVDRPGLWETASDCEGGAWEVVQHVLLKRVGKMTHYGRCGRKNVSNTPDLLRYLRLGAIWPSHRSAEECDELAPSPGPPPVPRTTPYHIVG